MAAGYSRREITYPIKGTKFNFWTFVGPGEGRRWSLLCLCGTSREVRSAEVKSGKSKSCGCFRGAKAALAIVNTGQSNRTHGIGTESKLYRAWRAAKNRCYNQKCDRYSSYGGAGLVMENSWSESFLVFAKAVGEPPSPLHSLDRVDNSKGYLIGNVRWATSQEQCLNRRSNRLLTYEGETKALAVWAEFAGITHAVLSYRLKAGWGMGRALSQPIRK